MSAETPTHIIDVTEREAWQLRQPPHWNEEWKSIYMDDRADDPNFDSEFETLSGLVIEFRYQDDPVVIARVMDAVTPEDQCDACGMELTDPDAPNQYRLDLVMESYVMCKFTTYGISAGRLDYDHNSIENAFAHAWANENEPNPGINLGHGILQDLVTRSLPSPFLSNRERLIAATAIQWLGTNCGLSFLIKVNQNVGNKLADYIRVSPGTGGKR